MRHSSRVSTVLQLSVCLLISASLGSVSRGDGQGDNAPDKVRPVPPPGVAVSDTDRTDLESGLGEFSTLLEKLRAAKPKPDLLADVEIYDKAVRYALTYSEFFRPQEIPVGKQLLNQGMERARQLLDGKSPWASQTGLVVRGYISNLDGSAQPYGLVIPETYHKGTPTRLDCWFHGRGETLSELNFINDRQRNPGEFTPPNTIVLHLYGRYCCANKLAGEVDLFEALDSVKRQYSIDNDRIVVRGFSMGGAACWQFATHFAGLWAAAAPGAGFSETADFLKVFQKETVQPTWFEQKLWHMYDCTDYALNLFNCPTVAYSGEIDSQKQAADMMEKALATEGMKLTHLIGPKTAHSYQPETKKELSALIDGFAAKGRDPSPLQVKFTTYTLRYNRMRWVTLTGLGKHWERANVMAEIDPATNTLTASTRNVTGLSFEMEPGRNPLKAGVKAAVVLDGETFPAPVVKSKSAWAVNFRKANGKWTIVRTPVERGLHKRPGLQGPIDDALMSSFLFVRPTGKPMTDKIGTWTKAEMDHAVTYWRKQHRGDARIKDDTEVTSEDIARHNLILWGDPSSNALINKLAAKLPIVWGQNGVRIQSQMYPASKYALIAVYPNPLNPNRYVVFNSSFTWREYDALNNARQIPKLPDWAVIDLDTAPNSRWPGKVVEAGFFGERWEYVRDGGR